MSFFFGGGGSKVKPQFTGLAVQTSTSAVPIGLWYGKNRGAGNIIWQGDFQSHKQKQGGKGGGGKGVDSYTYSGSYELGLCWGPIADITHVWKDQSKETSYAALGFSLFVGTNPQAPWGYLTSAHPTEALGYPDIAYLAVQNYDLGQSNAFPQHSFEVEALLEGTGVGGTVPDADPALVIEDFLANDVHGVGFNTSILSNLLSTGSASTTGDSAFQTYCQAMGFAMSPFMSSQQQAGEIIQRWADLCNTAIVWTGYSLKFHPYGPDDITANGVTYLADFPVRYELSDTDFIYGEGEDPIQFNRTDPADAFNAFSIIISNRDNEYNELPVPWRDQGLVDQFGLKNEDSMDAREITDPEMAAVMVTYMGQRKAYIRNTFEFKLGPQFSLLEPMDILQCTDPRFGTFLVLIREVNENDDDELEIVAEEYPSSISTNSSTTPQPTNNTPVNTNVSPGPVNPPIIFEPPASLSGAAQVWAAVSGGDGADVNPNWGGCYVWLSTDGVTYNQIGEVQVAARQGKLTATLPTYGGSNPDTGNTLELDMAMSGGELEDAASSTDAASGVTVSYVDGELLAYEDVNLTGPDAYDVTQLYRGLYGSTVGAHSSGTNFARLDDAIFKYDLPTAYVGTLLYLKFQSYNIFGGAVEDISSVAVYTYTPTGRGFGTGTGGVPSVPTGFVANASSGSVVLTWNQNPLDDNVLYYEVWRATGTGQTFGSASRVATVNALTWTNTALTNAQGYTFFLVAVNAVGSSSATSGVNSTPAYSGSGINSQSGTSYTFVLSDAGKIIECSNASPITVTIPPNSSVAFPVGTVIEVHQTGAGTVTLAPGSGVTIQSRGGLLNTAGQYAVSGVVKTGTDTWRYTGDMA